MENSAIRMESKDTVSRGIPGSTLKIIAIISMFIDHTGAIMIEGYLNNLTNTVGDLSTYMVTHPLVALISMLDGILRLIGRLGFPLFAFLLIEGFTYTKSKWKYARNLLIFALVSEIPFDIGFKNLLFYPQYQNVFFTLLIGLLVLCGIKYLAEERVYSEKLSMLFYPVSIIAGCFLFYLFLNTTIGSVIGQLLSKVIELRLFSKWFVVISIVIAIIYTIVMAILFTAKWSADQKNCYIMTLIFACLGVVVAELLHTDYSGFGVLTIVAMYYFRKDKMKEMIVGCGMLTLMSFIEATAFFTLIPISQYNGKRGLSLKYAFYAFYPVHILLLYGIAYLCGLVGFAIK